MMGTEAAVAEGPIVETRGLSVAFGFGRIVAVRELSLAVERGEIVALIGRNGAGKTAAIRAIAGLFRRDPAAITSGDIRIEGSLVNGKPPYEISKLGVAMVPERDKVFLELTPLEHFRLAGNGDRAQAEEDLTLVLDLFPLLRPHLRRPAGYLSGGQRQMLAFATALFRRPKVLLVDEFSQGLAPIMAGSLAESLRAINARGMTVMIIEQNVALAFSLARRVYILEAGRMVAAGTPAELATSESLTRTYLGWHADSSSTPQKQ